MIGLKLGSSDTLIWHLTPDTWHLFYWACRNSAAWNSTATPYAPALNPHPSIRCLNDSWCYRIHCLTKARHFSYKSHAVTHNMLESILAHSSQLIGHSQKTWRLGYYDARMHSRSLSCLLLLWAISYQLWAVSVTQFVTPFSVWVFNSSFER